MNLPKAIEKLTPLTKDADWIIAPELKDAIKLGIEALTRILSLRERGLLGAAIPPLEGETKE